MTKWSFVGAATPPPKPGPDSATVAVALPLEVQGILSLTQPAGGVADPTKNENLEYFQASWVPAPGIDGVPEVEDSIIFSMAEFNFLPIFPINPFLILKEKKPFGLLRFIGLPRRNPRPPQLPMVTNY